MFFRTAIQPVGQSGAAQAGHRQAQAGMGREHSGVGEIRARLERACRFGGETWRG